jgi:hypothetical protein
LLRYFVDQETEADQGQLDGLAVGRKVGELREHRTSLIESRPVKDQRDADVAEPADIHDAHALAGFHPHDLAAGAPAREAALQRRKKC